MLKPLFQANEVILSWYLHKFAGGKQDIKCKNLKKCIVDYLKISKLMCIKQYYKEIKKQVTNTGGNIRIWYLDYTIDEELL